MGLIKKKRPKDKDKPVVFGEDRSDSEGDDDEVSQGVLVRHGLLDGTFPVHGKTVAEVRKSLKKILNIASGSKAVINGNIVGDEDETINENITMINFVAPSSVKGAPRLCEDGTFELDGETIILTDGKGFLADVVSQQCDWNSGVAIDKAVALLCEAAISGLDDQPQPASVRWHVKRGNCDVVILEFDPSIQVLKWADKGYGDGAKYTNRRIALPFLIMKIPFQDGSITGNCELFARSERVTSLDNTVCWAPLLNVSPYSYDNYAWICTQYLKTERYDKTIFGQIHALHKHLWGGGFNRSSEANEGLSAFKLLENAKFDDRIVDLDKWEKETKKDPHFILGVKWKTVSKQMNGSIDKVTIRHLIEKSLNQVSTDQLKDSKTSHNYLRSLMLANIG